MSLFSRTIPFNFIPFILLITVQTVFAQQSPSSGQSGNQTTQEKKMAVLQQFNNRFGKNDTIWSQVIVYEGDTIPAKTYAVVVYVYQRHDASHAQTD